MHLNPTQTIEELLQTEGEILGEARSRSPILLSFLTNYRLEILIRYITTEPSGDQHEKVCFRYPFIAAELLSIEWPDMLHKIIDYNLDCLLKFLRQEKISSLHAGYFCKVMKALLKVNGEAVLNKIYSEDFHIDLVRHMKTASISDLLEGILISNEHSKGVLKDYIILVIDMILDSLHTNPYATRMLVSILQKHNEVSNWTDIAAHLSSPESLDFLVDRLCEGHPKIANESAKTLISVVENTDLKLKEWGEEFEITPLIIEIVRNKITDFERILSVQLYPKNTLGEYKASVVELLIVCLKLSDEFCPSMAQSNLPEIITDLFFNFPWNSILHVTFYRLLETVICSGSCELIEEFLRIDNLPIKLIGTGIKFDTRKQRGNFGHILMISNLILNHQPKALLDVPSGYKFKEMFVDFQNHRNTVELGKLNYTRTLVSPQYKPLTNQAGDKEDYSDVALLNLDTSKVPDLGNI